jgi:hypothetical protein
MSLTLLERDTQTTDFGFKRSYVADSSDGDATEFVSTAACFR